MTKLIVSLGLLLAASATVASAQAADGKTLYDANCKKCHGVAGTPVAVMVKKFPKLMPFDAAFFANRTDASIATIIEKGTGKGMKAIPALTTDAERLAVAKYMRTLGK